MKGTNRLKAATGMAMSAIGRMFAQGDGERCEKHGIRLRTMVPRGCYNKRAVCPVCERRTITMKIYPFKMYISACGLIWGAAIAAVVLIGPQIRMAISEHAAAEAAAAVVEAAEVDAMAQEWASLYRMLYNVPIYDRTEAFMEFTTGSREFKIGKRSQILITMPTLNSDGINLFMGLFYRHERVDLMSVIAKLAIGSQNTP